MIRYDLMCNSGHDFDGWFSNSDAFEKQLKLGLVECPFCGSNQIEKQLMTPGVPAKSNRRSEVAPASQKALAGPVDAKQAELMNAVRELRAHVEENADYVGPRFAEEARRMHFGETEERGIYGEATIDEAKSLKEDGIPVAPLPSLPEEQN